eukprot:6038850-Lingulodinium_polyedra.AAC.1
MRANMRRHQRTQPLCCGWPGPPIAASAKGAATAAQGGHPGAVKQGGGPCPVRGVTKLPRHEGK